MAKVEEEFILIINPLHSSFEKAQETILALGELTAPSK